MAHRAHIAPHSPHHLSTWVAGGSGLIVALAWTLVPAARIGLVATAVVVAAAAVQRLAEPVWPAAGGEEPSAPADSVAMLAEHGIRDLEAYLARHLAFEVYLEHRDAQAPPAEERSAG